MIYSRLPFALTAAGLRSDCILRAKEEQGAMPEKMRNLKQNRGEIERVIRKRLTGNTRISTTDMAGRSLPQVLQRTGAAVRAPDLARRV